MKLLMHCFHYIQISTYTLMTIQILIHACSFQEKHWSSAGNIRYSFVNVRETWKINWLVLVQKVTNFETATTKSTDVEIVHK